MKKKILVAVCLMMVSLSGLSQISVGLRDNRYVNVAYKLKNHWNLKLEHSIFSEKFSYQYIRLYAGYEKRIKKLNFEGNVYGGTIYCGDFFNIGARVDATYSPHKRFKVTAGINPHYDSDYGYSTCYNGGVWFNAYKAFSIVASVSNIPEYRKSENRAYFGFSFDVGKLWVSPRLSIPIEDSSVKSLRVVTSIRYEF